MKKLLIVIGILWGATGYAQKFEGLALTPPDGTKVYESGVIKGSAPTKSMAVNIQGASTLKLVVTDAGDGASNDWADWGDARLSVDLVPVLSLDYVSLSGGDGNGIFDPGETMEVHLKAENTGSDATGTLTATCIAVGNNTDLITINNPTVNLDPLSPGDSVAYTHSITVADDAPAGDKFKLRFTVSDGTTTVQFDKEFFITDMYLSDADYT